MFESNNDILIGSVVVIVIAAVVYRIFSQSGGASDSFETSDTSDTFDTFDTFDTSDTYQFPQIPNGTINLLITIGVIAAVIGGGWYMYGKFNENNEDIVPPASPPPVTTPSPSPPPVTTPPTSPPPVTTPVTTSAYSEEYQKQFDVDEEKLKEDKPKQTSTSNSVRYVRIEKTIQNANVSSQLYLNIAEVEVYDKNDINVSKGKKAYQVSTAPANFFWNPANTCREASCAVDGETNGDWFSTGDTVQTNSITHTYLKPTKNENSWDLLGDKDTIWWEVDLESDFELSLIKIYNRTDLASDRMKNARVIILDSAKNIINSYFLEDDRSLYEIKV